MNRVSKLLLGAILPIIIAMDAGIAAVAMPGTPDSGVRAGRHAGAAPEGVAPEVWTKIEPQLQAAMFRFEPDAAGVLRARNPELGLEIAADAEGVKVCSGVALHAVQIGWSADGAMEALPASKPSAAGARLEYRRGPVLEWFENRAEGLEQGFTVSERPGRSGGSDLRLLVAVGGARAAAVSADGLSARLTDAQGRDFGYGGLKAWDAEGKELACRMALPSENIESGISNPESRILLVCDTRGAAWPITIDPVLAPVEKKLTASDGAADDSFGFAVSVAGDVALVGAYIDDSSKGAAYVFERNAGGTNAWGEVKKLTASDGAAFDEFGISVSVAGDVALVGAFQADSFKGAAYVFERNAGGTNAWGEVKKLTASDGAEMDWFGWSVSVAGDVALVSACGKDSSKGAAYVFERNAGGTNAWGEVAKLAAADGAEYDYFGRSVSAAGDVALVGALRADSGKGAAYVFERNAGGTNAWGHVKKLTASDGVEGGMFGFAVCADGDVALVGAYGADSGKGAAYVFERNAGGTNAWGAVRKLTAPDGAEMDWFGYAVSVAGDVALVGAYRDDTHKGAAYVYLRNAGGTNAWGAVRKITASDGVAGDMFGWSVSVAGDFALVGAYGVDSSKGAAYIMSVSLETKNFIQTAKLTASAGKLKKAGPETGDDFGCAVSVAGDVVLVGAFRDELEKGAAYVFERNAGGTNAWGQVKKLTVSDGAEGDWFGLSVSLAGDVALVGACGKDSDKGAAYVFERNAGGTNAWGEVKKLTASDGVAYDRFGYSVSAAGDIALVGAFGDDFYRGSAYVFERNAGGTNAWGEVAKLAASDGAAGCYFGRSVSAAGDVALVGAERANSQKGAAYVFERNADGTNAWGQVKRLTLSDGAEGDEFGYSVSAAGDVALVGAYGADSGKGAAYVFERNAGGINAWGEVKKLAASDGAAGDNFGNSVSVAGDVAVVGGRAFGLMPPHLYRSAAYVFERNAGGTNAWGEVKKLAAVSNSTSGNIFGRAVSVAGDVAVVGGRKDDSSNDVAYVFENTIVMNPGMSVLGTNGAVIASGDASSSSKGSDFGSLPWGSALTHTFAITNGGDAALAITGYEIYGAGESAFKLSGMPETVAIGAVSNFSVSFSPALAGVFTASVHIANNSAMTPYLFSLSGTGVKGDQVITFPAIPPQSVTSVVELAATASSGLPVTFSVASGPGAVSYSATLTFSGTGVVAVVASQEGDADWNPAPPVTNRVLVRADAASYVPGDFDGDGMTDMNVYYADPYRTLWYSMNAYGLVVMWEQAWGGTPDGRMMRPVLGDYDGDGIGELCMYDEQTGFWYMLTLAGEALAWEMPLGGPGLIPVAGDYDGDGIWDLCVYSVADGLWYARTLAGKTLFDRMAFGGPGFAPVSGDYDGDGAHDLCLCYHDTLNYPHWIYWYGLSPMSEELIFWASPWGTAGWTPVGGDYDGDGAADLCAYDPDAGAWYVVSGDGTRAICWGQVCGGPGYVPAPGDYNGDGRWDMAVYHELTGIWYARDVAGEWLIAGLRWGGPGFLPLQ